MTLKMEDKDDTYVLDSIEAKRYVCKDCDGLWAERDSP